MWKKTRDGNHPIYEAVPANDVPGGPFTTAERAVIAAIRDGITPSDQATIEALKARGIVRTKHHPHRHRESFELDGAAISEWSEPFSIWLPNALIDGVADEVPPLELVRQTRSLPALRLFIELYSEQFLPSFGGVPRELLKREFERLLVGERGSFVVWGLRRNTDAEATNWLGRSLQGTSSREVKVHASMRVGMLRSGRPSTH